MEEENHKPLASTVKAIIAIVIIIALWPILEVIAGFVAAITTFAVGMGLAFILFILIIYPYDFTNNTEKEALDDIKKDIQNRIRGTYNNAKNAFRNKGD